MKKLLLTLLIISIATWGYAAPPTRQATYSSGTIISSSDVTLNEDVMFNYLQTGVDTYLAGSIDNADVNASAAIDSTKLEATFTSKSIVSSTLDDDGANGVVITLQNDGTNHGLDIQQDGTLAASKHALNIYTNTTPAADLAYIHFDNAAGGNSGLGILYDGKDNPIQITTNIGADSHLMMVPVASIGGTAEGQIYADTDGVLYYRSNNNFAACNAAADFAEIMTSQKKYDSYQEGTLMVLTSNLETDESSFSYQTSIVGILNEINGPYKLDRSDKTYKYHKRNKDIALSKEEKDRTKIEKRNLAQEGKTFNKINENKVAVALIGFVDCKVNNENGNINIGDLLTSSSTPGTAMKATPLTFDQYSAVIGRARENFNGTEGVIEIVVGVK